MECVYLNVGRAWRPDGFVLDPSGEGERLDME